MTAMKKIYPYLFPLAFIVYAEGAGNYACAHTNPIYIR